MTVKTAQTDDRFQRDIVDAGPPLVRPTYYVETPDLLPEAHHVEHVQIGGLLGLVWATIWCRQDSPAPTTSPVPWDPDAIHPWTIELHGLWPDTRGCGRTGVAFRMPCDCDPRIPSPQSDATIRAIVRRALLHEGQEGLLIGGARLDPHDVGEIGLALT
jgi:hypothetical protein